MSQSNRLNSRLAEAVRAAVSTTPDPARPISLKPLLWMGYTSTSGKSIVGVGLLLGVPLAVIEIWASQRDPVHLLFVAFAVVFTAFMLAVPALAVRRTSRALRLGLRAMAEVIDLHHRAVGDAATIDSIENGFASGRWLVGHPMGVFEATFETDAP